MQSGILVVITKLGSARRNGVIGTVEPDEHPRTRSTEGTDQRSGCSRGRAIRKSTAEKVAALKASERRLHALDTREQKRRENHAKILIGVAMIHQCQISEGSAGKFKALLEEFLFRLTHRLKASLFGLTLTVKKLSGDQEQGRAQIVELNLCTIIEAPLERCFDLSRSIKVHLLGTEQTGEQAIGGVTAGLGEFVRWRATHLGVKQHLASKITAYDRPSYFQTP